MIKMIKDLLNEMILHGNRGAIVPICRIDDLKQDMRDLQNGAYHTGYRVGYHPHGKKIYYLAIWRCY